MKFSQIFKPSDSHVLLIIGDGLREEKLIRCITPKFDGGKCILSMPGLPGHFRVRKGVSALEGLIHTLMRCKVDKALYIVDKEHVTNPDEVNRWLKQHGCKVEEHGRIREGVGWLRFTYGPRKIKLYIVIAGHRKSMDEEIEKLAGEVYDKEIKPENVKSLNIKQMLKKANIKVIKKYLGLASALQDLECN